MKFTPRPTDLWAAVLLVLCTACAVDAQVAADSKPTLSAELYSVTSPFTQDQQRVVDTYVDFYVNRLINGTDAEVVTAKAELISPLAKGGTAEFNAQYGVAVARRLGASNAMQSERQPAEAGGSDQRGGIVVRLNTMIVISRLSKSEAPEKVKLILVGLQDENPAVRYWAIRAIRENVTTFSTEQRPQLVAALRQMISTEQTDEVVRQLLSALIDLDAVDLVVQALNDLIKLHVGNPRQTYDAKREAMRSLLQKLIEMNARNLGVNQQFRELARAGCRYMILITQQAQGANLTPEIEADHVEMVRLCDQVLRTVHQQLGSTVAQPPSILAPLSNKNWAALQATALTWREILKQPPFNYADVDLSPAAGGQGGG